MHNYIQQITSLTIERREETCKRLACGRSTLYNRINEGLFPPPFSIGERAVAFCSHETDAIIKAMISGKQKDDIKELVKALIEYRQNVLPENILNLCEKGRG